MLNNPLNNYQSPSSFSYPSNPSYEEKSGLKRFVRWETGSAGVDFGGDSLFGSGGDGSPDGGLNSGVNGGGDSGGDNGGVGADDTNSYGRIDSVGGGVSSGGGDSDVAEKETANVLKMTMDWVQMFLMETFVAIF